MAKYGPSAAWLLTDGYILGAYLTEFGAKKDAVTEESTTLGDSWEEHLPTGQRQMAVTMAGFYDDANDASDEALSGRQNTSQIVCFGVEGLTIGKKFVGAEGAYAAAYERQPVRNALHKFSGGFTVSGQVDEGIILHDLTARTANWNTEGADSQDNGASTAAGGTAFAQVTAFSGFTSVTLNIRHSADDTTYATLVSLTAVTGGPVARRSTVAGTVNRHLAMSGTVSGSGSITAMVGFARG